MYIDVLRRLRNAARRKRPPKWRTNRFFSPSRQCSSAPVGLGKYLFGKWRKGHFDITFNMFPLVSNGLLHPLCMLFELPINCIEQHTHSWEANSPVIQDLSFIYLRRLNVMVSNPLLSIDHTNVRCSVWHSGGRHRGKAWRMCVYLYKCTLLFILISLTFATGVQRTLLTCQADW
jgi:hypothetical protein